MRGRFLILGAVLMATLMPRVSPALAAADDTIADGVSPSAGRFMLSCTGAMSTDGSAFPDRDDPAGRIVASGIVDLDSHQVSGFGLGAAPIVIVTADRIGFGSPAVDRIAKISETPMPRPAEKTGTIVEGMIDRVSGATTIVVRSASDPERVTIAMALECAIEAAPT